MQLMYQNDFINLTTDGIISRRSFFFFFFKFSLRPFQDYFSSYETGQSVGGRKREYSERNGARTHTRHSGESYCLCRIRREVIGLYIKIKK